MRGHLRSRVRSGFARKRLRRVLSAGATHNSYAAYHSLTADASVVRRLSRHQDRHQRGDLVQAERVIDSRPADDRDNRRQELHRLPGPAMPAKTSVTTT